MRAPNNLISRRSVAGFSLIELMVVIIISLFMSLAVFGVLSTSESKKRTTLASSDLDQAGSYAMYVLDKQIRSAGSAFQEGSLQTYGCLLNAKYQGSQILPWPGGYSIPPEFAALQSDPLRLAPILIYANQAQPYGGSWSGSLSGSDYIMVMSGAAGIAEVPVRFTGAPSISPPSVTLTNSVGTAANNLLLLIDAAAGTGAPSNCMIESVASTFTTNGTVNLVPLGGNYVATSAGTANLGSISAAGSAINLGNSPSFTIYGVGNNTTLFSYDMLQLSNPSNATPISQAVASDVYELKALYGVSTSTGFSWVDPSQSPWDYVTLTSGTSAATTALHQIVAIKLGMVLRSALPQNVCATSTGPITANCTVLNQPNPTLFAGVTTSPGNTSLTYTHTLTTAEKVYRFRTLEATIPIRNNLLKTAP